MMTDSLNVLPANTIANHADAFVAHSESSRNIFDSNTIGEQPSYFDDIVVGDFGLGISRAPCTTTLFGHVRHIVGLRAKPEVRGIDTPGIVAAGTVVASLVAIWNWAIGQFPGDPMRLCGFAIIPIANPNLSISLAVKSTRPKPTTIWRALVNFLPKSISHSARDFGAAVVKSDKANRLTLDASFFGVICCGNCCAFSTSALTVAIRNFKRWIVGRACEKSESWGNILHSNVSLTDLLTPRDDLTHRRGNFIGLLQVYFSTKRLEVQPCD